MSWDSGYRTPLPLILPRERIVLITNGKCGGTSVKRWLFDLSPLPARRLSALSLARRTSPEFAHWVHTGDGRAHLRTLDQSASVRRLTRQYARFVSTRWLERAKEADFLKLWFVRNPVDRCLSGYLDKFCKAAVPAKDWAREVVDTAGRGGTLSFAQFVSYLETADPDAVNGHWRRQTYNAEHFDLAQLVPIRIEALAEDLERVAHSLIAAKLARFGASNVNRAARAADRQAAAIAAPWDVANTDLLALKQKTGFLPPAEAFLTDALTARIRAVYAKDYRHLPYD